MITFRDMIWILRDMSFIHPLDKLHWDMYTAEDYFGEVDGLNLGQDGGSK